MSGCQAWLHPAAGCGSLGSALSHRLSSLPSPALPRALPGPSRRSWNSHRAAPATQGSSPLPASAHKPSLDSDRPPEPRPHPCGHHDWQRQLPTGTKPDHLSPSKGQIWPVQRRKRVQRGRLFHLKHLHGMCCRPAAGPLRATASALALLVWPTAP